MREIKVTFTKSEDVFRVVYRTDIGEITIWRRDDRWFARLWRWVTGRTAKCETPAIDKDPFVKLGG
jgi:hypothetical protein